MTDLPQAPKSNEHLVALAFDKPNRASEVLVNLMHLQQEGAVRIGDAVVLAKDSEGRARIVETIDMTPRKGALMGTWFGLLAGLFVGPLAIVGGAAAGALYGKLVDKGLADDWVKKMSEWLEAGRSALLLLVTVDDKAQLLTELERYGGELVSTDVPEPLRQELVEALHHRRGGAGGSWPAPASEVPASEIPVSEVAVVGAAEEGGQRPPPPEDGDVAVDGDLEHDERRL